MQGAASRFNSRLGSSAAWSASINGVESFVLVDKENGTAKHAEHANIPCLCDNPKNEIRLIRPQARASADSVFRVDGAYCQTTRVKRNLRPFVSICLHLRANSFFTSTGTVPNDPITRITGRGAQNGGDDFASGLTFVLLKQRKN